MKKKCKVVASWMIDNSCWVIVCRAIRNTIVDKSTLFTNNEENLIYNYVCDLTCVSLFSLCYILKPI